MFKIGWEQMTTTEPISSTAKTVHTDKLLTAKQGRCDAL